MNPLQSAKKIAAYKAVDEYVKVNNAYFAIFSLHLILEISKI